MLKSLCDNPEGSGRVVLVWELTSICMLSSGKGVTQIFLDKTDSIVSGLLDSSSSEHDTSLTDPDSLILRSCFVLLNDLLSSSMTICCW